MFVAKWGSPYFDINKQQQGNKQRQGSWGRFKASSSDAIAILEMERIAPDAVLPS